MEIASLPAERAGKVAVDHPDATARVDLAGPDDRTLGEGTRQASVTVAATSDAGEEVAGLTVAGIGGTRAGRVGQAPAGDPADLVLEGGVME